MTANLAFAASRAYQSGSAFFGNFRMFAEKAPLQKIQHNRNGGSKEEPPLVVNTIAPKAPFADRVGQPMSSFQFSR
jgi:hypothetical protein